MANSLDDNVGRNADGRSHVGEVSDENEMSVGNWIAIPARLCGRKPGFIASLSGTPCKAKCLKVHLVEISRQKSILGYNMCYDVIAFGKLYGENLEQKGT